MPKTLQDFVVLAVLFGGVSLSAISFALFLTGRGNPETFEAIGISVALLFAIFLWFGLGFAGIIRAIGTACIAAGIICLFRKPLPAIGLLLMGIASRSIAIWITRFSSKHGKQPHKAN